MNDEYDRNEFNERIEQIGDITLNLDYWDCDCDADYIHPIAMRICDKCEITQEESPSSIEKEIRLHIKR